METLLQDLRYMLRVMGRNPGFAAVAILTLALGIGANTAIFSLLDAVTLRTLPVREPGQLVQAHWTLHQPSTWQGYSAFTGCEAKHPGGESGCSFPYEVFDLFRTHARSFDGVFGFAGPTGVQALIRGEIVQTAASLVSGEFFPVLGVEARPGRVLDGRDDQPGAEPVAVLSAAYWAAHFGSDPKAIGSVILLEGAPFRIVGVTEREFFGLQPVALPDLWISLHSGVKLGHGWWDSLDSKNAWISAMGRLKPGVTAARAQAEMESLFRQSPGTAQSGIAVVSAARGLAGLRSRYSEPLRVLMGVVALVLLIACANLGNLLLARSSARRKEVAVRMAIGGGRGRLVRQLLTESLLLAFLGGAAGLVLAVWLSRALAVFFTSAMESAQLDVRLSPQVFGFTAAVAMLAAILFGLAPAISSTRVAAGAAMRSGSGPGGTRRGLAGDFLVAGEMAMALVLLVGAGLFLRTLVNLETADPGFHKDGLLTLVVARKHDGRPVDQLPSRNAELRERLGALPGVTSATWSSDLLLIGNLEMNSMRLDAQPKMVNVNVLRVGPGFFETMAIPILAGRTVTPQDCRPEGDAVWVNHAFAERYLAGQNPLGSAITRGTRKLVIAGVVGDMRYQSLRSEIAPTVFYAAPGGNAFTLRTAVEPSSLAGAVTEAVKRAAPELLVRNVKSESELVDKQLFTERIMARLSLAFGLLAAVMAAIGVYGVLAYSVTRRTGEIAIRMSLGAMPRAILRLILEGGLRPAAAGAVAGLGASYGVTRLIASFLFGVKPSDPVTYAAAALALLGIAALACYIPARRATKVDPMIALRYE
jgi:predicted permease